MDENIAFDYLSEGNIDLIVNVIDATNLGARTSLDSTIGGKADPYLAGT